MTFCFAGKSEHGTPRSPTFDPASDFWIGRAHSAEGMSIFANVVVSRLAEEERGEFAIGEFCSSEAGFLDFVRKVGNSKTFETGAN